jgi:hypothetical protein
MVFPERGHLKGHHIISLSVSRCRMGCVVKVKYTGRPAAAEPQKTLPQSSVGLLKNCAFGGGDLSMFFLALLLALLAPLALLLALLALLDFGILG